MVGASVFYNDVTNVDADGNKQQTGSQSSLDKLDQELKVRSLQGTFNKLHSYMSLLCNCRVIKNFLLRFIGSK